MSTETTTRIPASPPLSSSDLLACPFCGSPSELDTQQGYRALNGRFGSAVAIYCTKCPAQMSMCREDTPELSTEILIKCVTGAWNLRQANH